MGRPRNWSDEALAAAVAASRSWADVLRELGLAVGGQNQKTILRRCQELGIDTAHLPTTTTVVAPRMQRDAHSQVPPDRDEAERLLAEHTSWASLLRTLGEPLTGHDYRWAQQWISDYGLDASHLNGRLGAPLPPEVHPFLDEPEPVHLRRAAIAQASEWFLSRGYMVSIPMDVAPYDLVVDSTDGMRRIQVKSTNSQQRTTGRWTVAITQGKFRPATGRKKWHVDQHPYDDGVIDYFFIVCGDGSRYLIPFETTNGQASLVLDVKYSNYRV